MNENLDQFDEGFDMADGDETKADPAPEEGLERPAEVLENAESALPPEPESELESEPLNKQDKEDPAPSETAKVEIPENIAAELEELKKLSPAAAEIAVEDSPDGAALRSRLEKYGAEQAQDRAEFLIYQRREREREAKRETEARDAHNRNFFAVMQREAPEYCEMISNPKRKEEAAAYIADVYKWIEQKPYKEAAEMMRVAKSGRDPMEVSSLIKRFEQEKRGGKRDYEDAIAVPGRGVSHMGSGIGGKDDFDAGWNLHG